MARSPLIFLALSLIGAALAAWLIASAAVTRMETATREAAVTSLAAAGQNWASADPDGLRLVLSGEAPDETARFRALEVLGRIVSGARIADQTTLASGGVAEIPPLRLQIFRDAGGLVLSGQVPGEAERDALAARSGSLGQTVDSRLLAAIPAEAAKGWQSATDFAFTLLPLVEQGRLIVTPGRVDLRAVAASDAGRAALEAKLAGLQPGDVTLSLRVLAPLPVISPYEFTLSLIGGTAEVGTCMAETPAARARILSSIEAAGASLPPRCNLALGAPTPDWDAAVDLSITALGEAGGGRLHLRDGDVSLIVPAATAPDLLERVTRDLRSALPAGYVLNAAAETTVAGIGAKAPVLFTANRHSDGSITLSGVLPDAASRMAAATYAASLTRDGRVQNRVVLDPSLPEGWMAEALAGVETLSLLHAGSVTISAEKVYVEGRSASPDIAAEVGDVLRMRLAAGREASVLVVTDPALSEAVTPPANTECAAEIADILKTRQIAFAPNSARIAEESEPVIDDIAIVLKNCATAGFEIGGHTDSQGGEVLNQALSQARADAVLDALLARDVLISHLSARGYGESQPIGDNETEAGRAQNRRIAFKLLEDTGEQD